MKIQPFVLFTELKSQFFHELVGKLDLGKPATNYDPEYVHNYIVKAWLIVRDHLFENVLNICGMHGLAK